MHAAMTGLSPMEITRLKLNSSPRVNMRNTTPMSAHTLTVSASPHRGGVRHVAAGQKTGHDVTQYERLAQTLEKQGNHAGGNENEARVADERG